MMPQPETASRGAEFVGSVPALYDKHLGPLLFEPFARDLVRRLAVPPGARAVLEVAAGTGIVTQHLRRQLPSAVSLTATDLNGAMLAVAQARLREQNLSGVTWREADASALPFEPRSFDAVVCQFGVMFFPDKLQAARETRRVLRPGGVWLFNVWGSLAENELGRIAHETIAGFFKQDPPEFYRIPFGYSDSRMIRALLADAGFVDVAIEDVELTGAAPSARHAAIGLVQGSPVANAIRERGTADLAAITEAVAAALAGAFGDAPLRTSLLARAVSARSPVRE